MKGCLRGYSHTGLIIRTAGTCKNTRIRMELPTHLLNHLISRPGNRLHGKRGKQEGQHTSDKQADNHSGIHNINFLQLNSLRVGHKQSQCRQRGRPDGETFSDGCCCIADRIQSIRNIPDAFVQTGHFGNSSCIVGNRTVRINSNSASRCCQHAYRGKGNTIQAGNRIGHKDAYADAENRNNGGTHADRQSCYDGCSGPCLRLLRNAFYRFILI